MSCNFPGAAVLVPALSHCLVQGLDGALGLPFGPTAEGLNLPNPFFLAFTFFFFSSFSEVGMELSWRRKKQWI